MKNQSGQTLIETIVGIFILITALSSGLGLTIYVLSNSERSTQQLIATNLAKEGVNVVRNMRDTNWLESDHQGGTWALSTCTINTTNFYCYPRAWEGVSGPGFSSYDLSQNITSRLEYSPSTNTWSLAAGSYPLYLHPDGTYTHNATGGILTPFSRKVSIARNTDPPYAAGNLSQLIVTAVVGWTGKGCSPMTAGDPSTTNCSLTVTERLTNWKDYK